jgi:hypothetical protein
MKKIPLVVLLLVGLAWAQTSAVAPPVATNQLTLQLLDAPVQVPSASFNRSLGNPGYRSLYYWIVSNGTIGSTSPAGPYIVTNAPDTMSTSAEISGSWEPAAHATSYDVLRTTSPVPPRGACNCAVSTGVTSTAVTDQSESLSSYTVSAFDPNSLAATITNRSSAAGQSGLVLHVNGQDTSLPFSLSSPGPIGGTTPDTGTFTNVTGPIGETTPAAGTLTDLNAVPSVDDSSSVLGNITHRIIVWAGHLYAKWFRGVLDATEFTGSDIGAQINAAWAFCPTCRVFVQGATYNGVTTTVNYPIAQQGQASLEMDPGAVINYTGNDYFIRVTGTGNAMSNVRIAGGQIKGTSSGLGGIYLYKFQGAVIDKVTVLGFTAGDGINNQGANTVDYYSPTLRSNQTGLNMGNAGAMYQVVANHVHGGDIEGNSYYGILEGDGTIVNSGNLFAGITFQNNGNTGAGGDVWIRSAIKDTIQNCYSEASGSASSDVILVGSSGAGGAGYGHVIQGNLFGSTVARSSINYAYGGSAFGFGLAVRNNVDIGSETYFIYATNATNAKQLVTENNYSGVSSSIAAGVISESVNVGSMTLSGGITAGGNVTVTGSLCNHGGTACQTAAPTLTAWSSGSISALVTVTWAVSFPDANYRVSLTPAIPWAYCFINTKSASAVSFYCIQNSGASAGGSVDVTALHD